MARLRISIVTPSFNQAPYIERTIRSVLSQQGDFDLEYLVVDGASTDGTVEILKRYDHRLRWTSEADGGQVAALNRALAGATGDIVGWLNSDDTLLPGALARVAQVFRERNEVEWVHGRCEIIDVEDKPIRRWISLYKHLRAQRHSFENLLTENYISQMTCFWRRSLVDELGPLDPALGLTFDYDYWLRLAKRSAPVYLNERIACFRWYATSKSGANFAAQFAEDFRVASAHAPAGSPWILWRKRMKTALIVGTYRGLSLLRRLPLAKVLPAPAPQALPSANAGEPAPKSQHPTAEEVAAQ